MKYEDLFNTIPGPKRLVYSNTPSSRLNVQRLLNNQPYFLRFSTSSEETLGSKKNLLISANPFNRDITNKVINCLIKQGFGCYYMNYDGEICQAQEGNSISQDGIVLPSEDLNWLEDAKDKFLVIPIKQLPNLVRCLFDCIEVYAPYESVALTDGALSQEMIRRLLEEHGTKIKRLDLSDFHLHEGMSALIVSKLSHCEEIVLDLPMDKNSPDLQILDGINAVFHIHCYSDGAIKQLLDRPALLKKIKTLKLDHISDESLIRLLQSATELQTLDLSNCEISHEVLTGVSFQNLKKLSLKNCNITLESLNAILKEAPQVEELNLDNCQNFHGQLSDLKLTNLKNLKIRRCEIDSESLQALLQHAHEITDLDISFCRELARELTNFSLPHLKKLLLNSCVFNSDSLKVLLQDANELEVLDLQITKLSDDTIQNISLPKLKRLNLYHFKGFNIETVRNLLSQAHGLEFLNLEGWSNADAVLNDVSLPYLKSLDLDHSDISSEALQRLLQHATRLQRLKLLNCRKLTGTFEGFVCANLRDLNLVNCVINLASFQALIQPARHIQLVNIGGCKNLTRDQAWLAIDIPETIKVEIQQSLDRHSKNEREHLKIENQSKQGGMQQTSGNPSGASAELLMDFDTAPDEKTFKTNRQFVGKPYTPHPSNLRISSFQHINGAVLTKAPIPALRVDSRINRKDTPLQTDFDTIQPNAQENWYLGIFDIMISNEWQPLPSVSSQEEYLAYYAEQGIDLQISEVNPQDGFRYIRAVNLTTPTSIQLQVLLKAPLQEKSVNTLPEEIQKLIKFFRGFREGKLKSNQATRPQAYLDEIIKQRVGACRHRSYAFKYLMAKNHPDVPVDIISNGSHMYVEVYHQGTWVRCDLGGYDAREIVNNDSFESVSTPIRNPELLPTQLSSMNLGPRGTIRPDEYFRQAASLGSLTLDHTARIPNIPNPEGIETLTLNNISLNVEYLHNIFKRFPNLKTLNLKHIHLIDGLEKVDFSLLIKLEWVSMKGDFVSSNKTLNQVIARHPQYTSIRWVVESPNVLTENKPYIEFNPTVLGRVPIDSSATQAPTIFSLLDIRKGSKLITTSNPNSCINEFYKHCHDVHKPVFIVDSADQLKCNRPFIAMENGVGVVRRGPGGPLYDFIQQNKNGIILIDYSRFTASDLVQFNSMLDQNNPKVDGVPLPLPVIGIMNPEAKGAYQGSDFYSRFAEVTPYQSLSPSSLQKPMLENLDPDDETIELKGVENFESELNGFWLIEGTQLKYTQGKLDTALTKNPNRIVLKNPPMDDPAFVRFLMRFGFEHPQGPELCFYQGNCFENSPEIVQFSKTGTLPKTYEVLNTESLNELLGVYEVDGYSMKHKQGLIASCPDECLSLYMTSTLTENQWLTLIEACKTHNKRMEVTLAPGVNLPMNLYPGEDLPRVKWTSVDHTQHLIESRPELSDSAIMIDVSELDPSDLFGSIDARFDNVNLTFEFKQSPCYLDHVLSQGSTVVLSGIWSGSLQSAMTAYIAKRMQKIQAPGHLIVVSETESAFSCMTPSRILPPKQAAVCVAQKVQFHDRFASVSQALDTCPFVVLQGATGVGKTHFMQKQWEAQNRTFYDCSGVEQWINTVPKDPKEKVTLFIDEANMTDSHLSLYEGLLKDPPTIFYKKKIYTLTKQHKVIFAANPIGYGGERTTPRLFDNPHPVLEFLPIPTSTLKLPDKVDSYIHGLEWKLGERYPGQLILTPREYLMIAALAQALKSRYAESDFVELCMQIGFEITKNHIPKSDWHLFQPKKVPTPVSAFNKVGDYTLTESMSPAIQALNWQLALRAFRLSHPEFMIGGLGGLVLEGPPGVGKSDLVIKALAANGLVKEHEQFVFIPVSLDYEEKAQALLDAFHEGKVVIIDEINSSPMLERLLNALLEGHDLENKKAAKPGFLLFGTQNPSSMKGRQETTLPLKHRLQHVYVPDYTPMEKAEILVEKFSMPRKIALDMLQRFQAQQSVNPKLCFRDLLRWGKGWAEHQNLVDVQLNVVPVEQIGSTCKLAALATTEQYYAAQFGYTPIGLHKFGSAPVSIRQMAKERGSVQGEILEFDQWSNLSKDLGYDCKTIDGITNSRDFVQVIVDELKKDNLPLLTFSVDQLGHPQINPKDKEEREHAAVVTGYDRKTDELIIMHWGQTYRVDAHALYLSNQALATKRSAEHYTRNPEYKRFIDKQPKYTPVHQPDQGPGSKSTGTPSREGSGFKGKILVIEKPKSKEALLQRRSPGVQPENSCRLTK